MPCVSVIIYVLPAVLRDAEAKSLIINLFNLFLMAADVVVAINGVWILVETYTLNSKIFPDDINACN